MAADPILVSDLARAAAADYKRSDLGNAERLVDRHGGDLRYAPGVGWLAWDGARFRRDRSGEVVRRMAETVRSLYVEAETVENDDDRRALVRHALASERENRIRGAISLAETFEGVVVEAGELDSDPWLLNVANGTIDLRTGELGEHRRSDLITRHTSIAFDAAAACPTWLAFLDRVFAGDHALVDFLQRAVGYSLTGETREQVLLILYGTGANGKSTFIETVRALAGDYGLQTPAETFLERRSEGIRNDVARLHGARFVSAVEMPEGRRLDEVLVKRLTGGDTLTARFLRREHFEFRPTFTPWCATNHKPAVRGNDEAIWRRLRLVPFTVTIPETERDRDLAEKLRDELPGILAWAVEGCLAWQRDGLDAPDAVREATSAYRAEEDILAPFLEERCYLGADAKVPAGQLFAAYQAWASAAGVRDPLSQVALGKRLGDREGLESKRTGAKRYWHGIGLLADEEPFS